MSFLAAIAEKASLKDVYVALIIGSYKYVYYHLHWCCLAGIPFDDHVVASSSSDTSPRYEGDETSSPILDDSSIRNRNKYSRHCGGTYQSTGSTAAAVDKGELLAATLWCQCTDFNNFNLIWDYFCN